MIDYKLLGTRIATFRKQRRLTQAMLAEKADISDNYVSNIENSYSIPSLETFCKLCGALEITPNDLLVGITVEDSAYLESEITTMLDGCTPQEKRYIVGFINVMKEERDRH